MSDLFEVSSKRALEIKSLVEEMWLNGVPKSRRFNYAGHINEIFLFLDSLAAKLDNDGDDDG